MSAAALGRWFSPAWQRWALLGAVGLAFGGLALRIAMAPPAGGFAPVQAVARDAPAAKEEPFYRAQLIPNGSVPVVHSASAAVISGGRLRAFWYGGSGEGAADVAIYSSVYTLADGSWSPERIVVTREIAQRRLHRYVRKLGNPVVGRDRAGRLCLYFVSVAIGGWAASAINLIVSEDEGETWSAPRRLIASPFLNVSTLVRGAPFPFADGAVGLPVYHEMAGKFTELLRLDTGGYVVGKTRLSWGRSSLQPVIVPRSETEAVGFMRYAGKPPNRVLEVRTTDGGATWSAPAKTALLNPHTAVASLLLTNGALLLAFNNTDENREGLSLALSTDFGNTWRIVIEFEERSSSPPPKEYSYPWIVQDEAGDVHVFYTWDRAHIKHVHMNPAWLAERR